VDHLGTIVTVSLALYAAATGINLISENRRPQATMAWMPGLFFLPGFGLLAYVLFGRGRKAFARQSKLLRQDFEANAKPLLAPSWPAKMRRSRDWRTIALAVGS
jgi:cardiolipin synthase